MLLKRITFLINTLFQKGGTDAGAAHTQNEGIPSTVIGVVGRYIHTHQTMFSIRDFEAAREMLIQTLKRVRQINC